LEESAPLPYGMQRTPPSKQRTRHLHTTLNEAANTNLAFSAWTACATEC
jgi:hypothetical protein